MSPVYEKLLAWQKQAKAEAGHEMSAIVHSYCKFMAANGVDLYRVTLSMFTLHPQIEALRYVWYDDQRDPGPFPSPALFMRKVHHLGGCTVDEALMSYGAKDTAPFRRSPFYAIMQGTPKLDFRLKPGAVHDYPILDDLAGQGATHYAAFPMPGLEDSQVSLVTRAEGGFDAQALDFIESSLSAFAILLDGALKTLILDTVLNCYVGTSPADEIKRGNIRPGVMLDLHGAIWFSDIRNYSTHTQNLPPNVFIGKLNEYYQCVVPIIYEHQGEVLKFIGDAVLAIFADNNPDNEEEACRRALSAAQATNRALAERGIEFDHGIGLHVGHFQFGNIGSLRRLDFTVIGNEVNVAARIEAKCSALGQRLLMSEPFVAQCGMPANLVSRVELKGIAGDYGLYAPD